MISLEIIESRIRNLQKIRKWEVMFWVQERLRLASEKNAEMLFSSIIDLLPRAIILALGANNHRSVIFQITDTAYNRVADCLPERHPPKRNFPREHMPPPIRELVDNGSDNLYIKNPLTDKRTEYMRELVVHKNIKAIYYTKVNTPNGVFVLVVDATDDKTEISGDEKRFLDAICCVIKNIEEERVNYEKYLLEVVEKKRKELAIFLLGAVGHFVRNKLTSIGGFAKKISIKIPRDSQPNKVLDCTSKDSRYLDIINKEIARLEEFLNVLNNLINELKSGFLIKKCVLDEILPSHLRSQEISELFVSTDINRARSVINNLLNKIEKRSKVVMNIRVIPRKEIQIIFTNISQKVINEIKKILSITERRKKIVIDQKDVTQYSLEELLLMFSILLFKETGGKISIIDNKLLLIFNSS